MQLGRRNGRRVHRRLPGLGRPQGDRPCRVLAQQAVLGLGASHGRVMVIDDAVGKLSTGHGIVMPMCVHGGPGRAGGGEELGGERGLHLYMQRTALEGDASVLKSLL